MTAIRHTPAARLRRLLMIVGGLLAAVSLGLPGGASAATARASKVVHYGAWSARVPSAWPVYRLGAGSRTCVRFNRHAVYLGVPGRAQACPTHALGRTDAILVSPVGTATASTLAQTLGGRGVAAVTRRAEHVTVIATWRRDPALVRGALGVRSLPSAARAFARREASVRADARALAPAGADVAPPTAVTPPATTSTTATTATTTTATATTATAGEVYTGLGFDACQTPSQSTMTDWAASPFRALGVYIGGTNMACSQPNLTSTWTAAQAAAGWHLIPIYVGLQSPNNGCGCAAISTSTTTAATQGAQAADAAIAEAQALGLGSGNPIYDDMENYTRTAAASASVLAYLEAWTTTLHTAGYQSGVYSSELSGIEDLVAEYGTGYSEPDDIWVANWNGQQSTTDSVIPATEWAAHQRLHQYRGGHTDSYGGASLSIDSDYIDAATAAPGTGTGSATVTTTAATAPTLRVTPQGDGSIDLAPAWSGQTSVTQWRILAGASPSALTTMITVPASHHTVVTHNADPYFQVQGLNAAGQEVGSSGTTATRPHLAMFGRSAFVSAHGPGGLPVECFGIGGCRISTTIRAGRKVLARTGYAKVAAGGGIDHFALSAAVHRLITKAGIAGVTTTVTIRSSNGRSATRPIKLIPFTTSGPGPRRIAPAATGSSLRLVGATDFVSHGWSGGILVACAQSTACSATPSITVRGRAIATAHAQQIGAGEVGYLSFRMTPAGHRLLMATKGNQLGATVAVSTASSGLVAGTKTSGYLSLDAF